MKEEIIEKLIKSPNKEDLFIGLRYAWEKMRPNREKFEIYLRELRPPNEQSIDVYIDKEINVCIFPNLELSVYGAHVQENDSAEVFHI